MTTALLPCVEVEPDSTVTSAVIWMHGLGANGHDFEPVLPWLGLPSGHGVRFVFPHAPEIPVTLNDGMVMPAWYDIIETDLSYQHDRDGILRSRDAIRALVRREVERGVQSSRIVLAGFSQGGAVALDTGLRHGDRLAGILALSTYLVFEDELAPERDPANAPTPILQVHGTLDPTVPVARGLSARDRLRDLGYTVRWQEYPMQHEVCPEELGLIGEWLREVLAD